MSEHLHVIDPIWKPAVGPRPEGEKRLSWDWFNREGPKFVVPIAIVTFVIAGYIGAQRAAPDLRPFLKLAFPTVSNFERIDATTYAAKKGAGVLGYATIGVGDGYGGLLSVAVAVDRNGKVQSVAIVNESETPAFLQKVIGGQYLRRLLGKSYQDRFQLGADVDGVSGATYTWRGLADAVRQGTRTVAAGQLGLKVPVEAPKVQFGIPEIVLIALFIVGFIGRGWVKLDLSRKIRTVIRWVSLLGGLVFLGFLFNRPMVLAWVTRLMSGDWPAWQTHFYWYLLFFGLLFSFGHDKKNPWCPWMCPFGAAQDCLGLIGGARNRQISYRNFFLWTKRFLTWLAIVLALLYRNPAGTSYEIFGTMFELSGTHFQFTLLAIVVLTAIFVNRPFCHWLCPVDMIEDLLRVIRRGVDNAWQRLIPRRTA